MPATRRAIIVFPAPGGPAISALWPPAAATSSARRAMIWPWTSAKSPSAADDSLPLAAGGAIGGAGVNVSGELSAWTASSSDRTG